MILLKCMLAEIAPWIWYISLSREDQVKPPVTVSSGCSSQSSAPPLALTVSVPQPLHKICKHIMSKQWSIWKPLKPIKRKWTRTASLHSLANTLYAVQVGQLVVGEESLCDSRVKAPRHSTALSRFILESHFHAVHCHGCSGAAAAEVSVDLAHGLLDELLPVTVHLQSQVTWLQVPQLLHLTPELGLLHLEPAQFGQDLQRSKQSLSRVVLRITKRRSWIG